MVLSFSFLALTAQEPKGLLVGDVAPNFAGTDQNGKSFQLYKSLEQNPVVLIFYRGEWCKHCNKHLSAIHDSLSLITDKGAIVIGVSPELHENIQKTAEKTDVEFPLVYDDKYKIMNAYDVSFTVDPKTVRKYKMVGINLTKAHGDESNTLPVPATYIIGQDKKISFVHFDPDYKYENRATVKSIIEHL